MHTVHSMEFQDELETTAEHMVSHNAMCLPWPSMSTMMNELEVISTAILNLIDLNFASLLKY